METAFLNHTIFYSTNHAQNGSRTYLSDVDLFTESTTFSDTDFDTVTLTAEDYSYIGIYLSMAVLGVIFNVLTLLTVGLGQTISKDIKMQLMNLAFADLLMALFDPAHQAAAVFRNSPFYGGTAMCRLYLFIRRVSHYAPLLCNVAISLERFVVVFFPFRAASYKKVHKCMVVLLIWVCAIMPAVKNLIYAQVVHYSNTPHCLFVQAISSAQHSTDTWLLTTLVILPAGTIATVYIMIFIKLCIQKTAGAKRHLSRGWSKELDKVCINSGRFFIKLVLFYRFFVDAKLFIKKETCIF